MTPEERARDLAGPRDRELIYLAALAHFKAAIAEEREACSTVAEMAADLASAHQIACSSCAATIADAIRTRA